MLTARRSAPAILNVMQTTMTAREAAGTIVWTGASSGIGRRAAAEVLRRRPDLHLLILVRGGGQGAPLASELATETGNPHVSAITCDLAVPGDIRTAAVAIGRQVDAGQIPPLRGYVGNAGLMSSARTPDGFDITFAVNVLANYLLLRLLLPRFEPPARLIVVGSDVHFADFRHNLGLVPRLDWHGTETAARPGAGQEPDSARARMRTYARSKLGVIYLVHALSRRAPGAVDVYTYSPGGVPGTRLNRQLSPAAHRRFQLMLRAFCLTPFATGLAKAGVLLAEAAVGPRPGPTGSYVDRGRVMASSPESYDLAREDELWDTAARLCGLDTAELATTV
jgi:NAD(P)-dependent dehydrogenase (short-subunit alcohol dehydrogenase family)